MRKTSTTVLLNILLVMGGAGLWCLADYLHVQWWHKLDARLYEETRAAPYTLLSESPILIIPFLALLFVLLLARVLNRPLFANRSTAYANRANWLLAVGIVILSTALGWFAEEHYLSGNDAERAGPASESIDVKEAHP